MPPKKKPGQNVSRRNRASGPPRKGERITLVPGVPRTGVSEWFAALVILPAGLVAIWWLVLVIFHTNLLHLL